MTDLLIELDDVESEKFTTSAIPHEVLKSRNLDGEMINTIIISLVSPVTIKILCNFLLALLKQRRSGKVKINGIEFSNVTEATINNLVAKNEHRKR